MHCYLHVCFLSFFVWSCMVTSHMAGHCNVIDAGVGACVRMHVYCTGLYILHASSLHHTIVWYLMIKDLRCLGQSKHLISHSSTWRKGWNNFLRNNTNLKMLQQPVSSKWPKNRSETAVNWNDQIYFHRFTHLVFQLMAYGLPRSSLRKVLPGSHVEDTHVQER